MAGCRKTIKQQEIIEFKDLNFICQIGKGAFGKVFLAKVKNGEQLYAVKTIRKDVLIQTDQIASTVLEKDIMLDCDHPFMVGMDYLFQTDFRLYFVMPFVRGGELYKVFLTQRRFPEEVIKFYIAQIIHCIGYLHDRGFAHRDLKLENLLVDADGYIKVIDFGLAKSLDPN